MIEVNRGQTYRFIWLSLVCDLFMQHRCSFIDIRTYLPDALTNIWIRKRRGDLALCSYLMTAVHSQTNSRHAESLGSSRFKRSTWSTRGIGKSKKQAGLIFDLWLRNVLSLVKQSTNQQWWRKIHCQGLLFVLFVSLYLDKTMLSIAENLQYGVFNRRTWTVCIKMVNYQHEHSVLHY